MSLDDSFQSSRNYTKLTVLSFLYCFVVKGNLISTKWFPPVGIDPATPLYFHPNAYPSVLNPQLLIEIPISCKIATPKIQNTKIANFVYYGKTRVGHEQYKSASSARKIFYCPFCNQWIWLQNVAIFKNFLQLAHPLPRHTNAQDFVFLRDLTEFLRFRRYHVTWSRMVHRATFRARHETINEWRQHVTRHLWIPMSGP